MAAWNSTEAVLAVNWFRSLGVPDLATEAQGKIAWGRRSVRFSRCDLLLLHARELSGGLSNSS